jgi:peptide/nickel transport system permease protein
MGAYVVRRLLVAIPTLWGVMTISFLLLRILPGDPAQAAAGPDATPEDIERLRQQLGFDRPLIVQYFSFLGNVVTGNLGISSRSGNPVTHEIAVRAPNSLYLALIALVVAVIVGCGLGVVAAIKRGTIVDLAVSGISVLGVSMPVYWTGLILIIVFSVDLHWLPSGNMTGPSSFVLPALTLAIFAIGFIARQTRSAVIETLGQDYIRTVRARGVGPTGTVLRHGLRNAALPVVTVIGLQFGTMLGGAVITETIFAWPGIGRLIVDSISGRDYNAVQGTVLVIAVALILVNLITDLVYAYLDPRIRYV